VTRRLREALAIPSIALGLAAALWGTFGAAAKQDAAAMALAFVVAALLIGFGAGTATPEPAEGALEPRRRVPRWVFAAAPAALLVLVIALRGFGGYAPGQRRAWALYVAALFLLAAAAWPFGARRRVPARRVSRAELAALLAVLAVGATFRLHLIRSAPYGVWFDEAQNVLVAKAMIEHPDDRPVFVADLSQMPAMYFYYVAGFVKVVGPRLLAVRLATTAAGLLALVFLWALARELFDPWVGIAAAGLLAVSRWHVTFSRFGVANIFTTVFIPLALLLFVRSQKRASAREAVLAGLAIGIGLQFYYALLTLPVIAVAFFAHRYVSKKEHRGLFPVALLGLTLVAMLFTYAPVMQYARRHSEQFNQRMRTVSAIQAGSFGEMLGIFAKDTPRRAAAIDVLRRNTIKHAAMFHLVGDSNGRHNLPGAPMLDPVSGALFAVGFLWCLALLLDSRHALLLLWFGAMVSAGILSLDFEAPQGARTFGATSVIALMGALPLAAVARRIAGEGGGRMRARAAALLVAAFSAVAGFFSWRTFFDAQLWDGSAFAAFSAPETKIGEVVRAEGESSDVFVPAIFNGGPTESLLVGRPYAARSFDRSRDLPLSVKRGRSAIVFFGGEERLTVDLLRKYYPNATIEPFAAPGKDGGPPGPTILWVARVPADEMERLRGWTIEVRGASGAPRTVATSASEWSWKSLGERAPFGATVRGTLRVSKDGLHALVLESDSPARLDVDGETILGAPGSRTVELARGCHSVEVVVDVRGGPGATRLLWRTPDASAPAPLPEDALFSPSLPTGGLLGSYFAGRKWAGAPLLVQIDPMIAFYYHTSPVPFPFSVRWSGRLLTPEAGTYRLGTVSIDASSLLVDGREVLANPGTNVYTDAAIPLVAGAHAVDLFFETKGSYAQVYLYWLPPGAAEKQLVPADRLRPAGPLEALSATKP
jgi:hypothetical protein